MTEANGQDENRRGLRILGLLLLAGALLWGAVLFVQMRSPVTSTPAPVSTAPRATAALPLSASPAAILKATPWAVAGIGVVPTATAEPANVPPVKPVTVLGPPPDSNFALDEPVTFYWTWPELLEEGQGFAVYLQSGDGEYLVGIVEDANLGRAYQLTAELGDAAPGPGQYLWQVRLEVLGLNTSPAQSAPRAISLREG